jgi:hypothetical protein
MPVEGQWERQQTPLRRLSRRELRLLQAVVGTLLAAAVAVLLLGILNPAAPTPAGCIDATGPSTMGGAVYRVCGADVPRWCRQEARQHDPVALAVQARCRALGISPR